MKERILVVDNNLLNLEFIRYLLTAFGYEVTTANSISGGLEILGRTSRFHLIISDLNVDSRSGFDFLVKVKNDDTLKDIPFVIISSTSREQKDINLAFELGAIKFIHRPVEPQYLLTQIEACFSA